MTLDQAPATDARGPFALSLQGAAKTFGPVIALADGTIQLARRRDPRPRRRERRRQVDARQDPRRAVPPRRRRVPRRRRGRRVPHASPTARPPASRSSTRSRPSSPTSPSPRTSSSAASRRAALGLISRAAMRRRPANSSPRLGVPIDPDRVAEGLSIADQQIIEIAKAISLDAKVLIMDEPTAALSRRRGRPALRRRAQPARQGRRHPVHLAPLRRGLRAVRPHHGHARRPLHRHARHHRGDRRRRSCARWSAATSPPSSPRRMPRSATSCSPSTGLGRAGVFSGHLFDGAGGRDRRPRRASSAPGAPRSPARSSASTPTTRARVTLARQAARSRATRRPRSTPASASFPRTAASRAS